MSQSNTDGQTAINSDDGSESFLSSLGGFIAQVTPPIYAAASGQQTLPVNGVPNPALYGQVSPITSTFNSLISIAVPLVVVYLLLKAFKSS